MGRIALCMRLQGCLNLAKQHVQRGTAETILIDECAGDQRTRTLHHAGRQELQPVHDCAPVVLLHGGQERTFHEPSRTLLVTGFDGVRNCLFSQFMHLKPLTCFAVQCDDHVRIFYLL